MASDTPDPKQSDERIPALDPRNLGPAPSTTPTEALPVAQPGPGHANAARASSAAHEAAPAAAGAETAPGSRFGRWSGRRTAAAAALALVLGGAGAVAIAADLPDGSASAEVGDRSGVRGGQFPGGQFPGARGDDHDHDADHFGPRGEPDDRGFPGGSAPQGGLPGGSGRLDPDGGTNADIWAPSGLAVPGSGGPDRRPARPGRSPTSLARVPSTSSAPR